MKTARDVPCPYLCGAVVDVFDEHLFVLNSTDAHICPEALRYRAVALLRGGATTAEELLLHITSEVWEAFRGQPEVKAYVAKLRSAAKRLRR